MTLERSINPETGEIGTFVPDGEGYTIQSQEQREAGRRYFEGLRNPISGGRSVDFTFTAMEAIGEVISVLSTAQCGFLAVIQCYVNYDSNALINADKTPMSTADMMRALKLERKRSTFYAFLAAAQEHAIITVDDSCFSVNPRYHFRGSARDTSVIRTYTAKIKQTYTSAKQAADIGLIYRMLPFVNYEMNALCSNPTERDPRKVDWFNRKQLAEAIGISEAELTKRIRRLTAGDEYVVARINVGGETMYVFNPLVFKRNSRPLNHTEQFMFNVKYKRG
jgi:hypothetical protein